MSAPQHPHPLAALGRWLALAAAAALLIDSLPEVQAQPAATAAAAAFATPRLDDFTRPAGLPGIGRPDQALPQGTDVPGIDP